MTIDEIQRINDKISQWAERLRLLRMGVEMSNAVWMPLNDLDADMREFGTLLWTEKAEEVTRDIVGAVGAAEQAGGEGEA